MTRDLHIFGTGHQNRVWGFLVIGTRKPYLAAGWLAAKGINQWVNSKWASCKVGDWWVMQADGQEGEKYLQCGKTTTPQQPPKRSPGWHPLACLGWQKPWHQPCLSHLFNSPSASVQLHIKWECRTSVFRVKGKCGKPLETFLPSPDCIFPPK